MSITEARPQEAGRAGPSELPVPPFAAHGAGDPACTDVAWIALDSQGRIADASRCGLELVAACADAIGIVDGRLRPARACADWDRLLKDARAGHRTALALPRAQGLPLTVRCEPWTPGRLRLVLRDPQACRLDEGLLRQLFRLTGTEARVAAALARGLSLADIAAVLGVQDNTARAHVKSVLSKTATQRQPQLVALLWGCVASG